MDFTLVDQALFGFVDKLNRIFNGQDMLFTALIDIIDHGSERGWFTRTCWTGNQYHTTFEIRDTSENLAHTQIFHGQYFGWNGTKHRTCTAILIEGVDTKTCQIRNFKRKIRLKKLFEVSPLLIIHDVINKLMYHLMGHWRHIDTRHFTINTNHRWHAGWNM